jgi:hypothetical protein
MPAPTNGYCTVAQLKDRLFIAASDTSHDQVLTDRINAASRAIDTICQRHFYQINETRYFTAVETRYPMALETRYFSALEQWEIMIDDLSSLSSLATDNDGSRQWATVWAGDGVSTITDFELEPKSKKIGGVPYPYRFLRIAPRGTKRFPSYPNGIKISGVWGWDAIPDPVVDACLLLASRLFRRAESPLGMVGVAEFPAQRIPQADPDVMQLLAPYIEPTLG